MSIHAMSLGGLRVSTHAAYARSVITCGLNHAGAIQFARWTRWFGPAPLRRPICGELSRSPSCAKGQVRELTGVVP